MSAQLESFTGGVATAVDVTRIERQLAELWQMAADSETAAVTRACMGNLVAICDSAPGQEHATNVIRELTSRHPCRAIVLLALPANLPDEMTAAITAHCHLAGGGGKQVCCEQISIRAAGRGVPQLAGAVLPLLEADLPTFCWWHCEFPAHADLFDRLAGVADRVFFDTSLWRDPDAQLPAVLAAIRRHPRRQFADLSWTRLGLWRAMTADLFDAPECRAEIPRLRSAEIVHGSGSGAALRARLFAGWLRAQLGPTLACRLRGTDDPQAGMLQLRLQSTAGQFELRKHHGEQTASSVVHLPAMCELPRKRAFWPADDASLLAQELDAGQPHAVYERAVQAALTL